MKNIMENFSQEELKELNDKARVIYYELRQKFPILVELDRLCLEKSKEYLEKRGKG